MCNICINSLTFISRDLNKLKKLNKIVNDVASNKNANSIVALLDKHGYNTKDNMLLCDKRDYISDCDTIITQKLNHYYFQAETCSAWLPNLLPIATLLKERYNGEIKLLAQSEEEGAGIYHTNDIGAIFYKDRFKVDCCTSENYETEYFSNWSDMINFLQELFPKADISYYDSIEELLESIDNNYNDGLDDSFFFNLNVFTPYDGEEPYTNEYYIKEAA